MANFTKGPLKTHCWTNHGLVIATESGVYLGYAQGYPNPQPHQVSESVAAANGQLWAAAPELFDALQALLDTIPFACNPHEKEIHEQARAALVKAVSRG